MKDIYIVAAKRTPFGKYRGFFKNVTATDLGVMALKGTLAAGNIDPQDVEALFMGNVLSSGLGENVARQVALYSGMRQESAAVTINEVCGSSIKAVRLAQGQMELGDLGLVAVGGSESMTRAPYLVKKEDKDHPDKHLISSIINDGLMDAFSNEHMGMTAENVAERYHVSRQEMDEFSLRSHQKATAAVKSGFFKNEILPIELNGKKLDHDELIRPDTTLEALGKLKPVFKENGLVTAGNSSPLTDGASMLVLATKEKVTELGLKPIAKLGNFTEAGFDPAYMGYTPYFAVKKMLQNTGRSITDYDIVELNEAFAAQSVAVARDLAIPAERLNIMGGAIALGHPLGATGTRLIASAISGLKYRNAQRALVTLCIGGGQAIAYEIENVE
ncbi:thiolase family protein [Lactobacillus kefiranofaciens subsp. kefirgranum]|uniref:thiolase family protein n=1 Tax=Lactobacillus kefiranofaciens TaxID=267818 RepID=UPI000BA5083B|nr:thiolase family protein [Lactobacillus kefiranofaciens]MCJ2171857.1 thiolase family protein [Lactobacillus kefiranofaciens]MCP9330810.1 thiolase family protein [Lactobacillus kefiranofaciens]MDF4142440.1 thiolase family protein [Lactobacillus kefiranofaciens]PAK98826.1 3-ketoacyl-CoA thiolase [Lactobacillus kefiranofaciens]QNT43696.1 thiolase family protein [Lactobacillus kefiranofaciens]